MKTIGPIHYSLKEFFRAAVVKKYGHFSWNFIAPNLIKVMDWIRQTKNKPVYVNHNGMFQRGFRDNMSPLVREKKNIYISPHCTGNACDFNIEGETADNTRQWLAANAETLPCAVRLEQNKAGRAITWVHLDLYTRDQKDKVTFFNVA